MYKELVMRVRSMTLGVDPRNDLIIPSLSGPTASYGRWIPDVQR